MTSAPLGPRSRVGNGFFSFVMHHNELQSNASGRIKKKVPSHSRDVTQDKERAQSNLRGKQIMLCVRCVHLKKKNSSVLFLLEDLDSVYIPSVRDILIGRGVGAITNPACTLRL